MRYSLTVPHEESSSQGFGLATEKYLSEIPSPNAKRFFRQVFSQGIATYTDRLIAIGFVGLGNVLDLGCGFGQWSVALAKLNRSVDSFDIDPERVKILQKIALDLSIDNIHAAVRSIDLVRAQQGYDGIFCYSSLYYSDYRNSIPRLAKALAPGGLLYIGSNDLGWYIYNLLNPHNDSEDFSSRDFALQVIDNSLNLYTRGIMDPNFPIVTPLNSLIESCEEAGLEVLGHGPDGSVTLNGKKPTSFYRGEYLGLTSVFEILCRKR